MDWRLNAVRSSSPTTLGGTGLTEASDATPSGKEGAQQTSTDFTEDEREVLDFLANSKRVDLRWLNEDRKTKIKTVIDGLHNGKKLSLLQISKEVGRSYMAIWGLCRALEIRTRSVAEAQSNSAESRSKHKRRPFGGTEEDRAYMLGFKNGDLTAWQVSGTAVMVTSTTTHPAFAELFRELFREYGHVYEYPMYEEGKGYKWKLAVRLDNSFRFLLKPAVEAVQELSAERSTYLSWLAGLVDSDGNIYVSGGRGSPRIRVGIYNSDVPLLKSIITESRKIQYDFDGPYLLKEKGTVTPFGIRYTRDLWHIDVQQTWSAQRLLLELPIRHAEKLRRKSLGLQVGRRPWSEIEAEFLELRKAIRREVDEFLAEAEERYRNNHGFPGDSTSTEDRT